MPSAELASSSGVVVVSSRHPFDHDHGMIVLIWLGHTGLGVYILGSCGIAAEHVVCCRVPARCCCVCVCV
jgi:hypothetical protein